MSKDNTPLNIRGKINHIETQDIADKFFKEHVDTEQIRLLVFIDYCLKNGGSINPSRITISEDNIIRHWCFCGYLEYIDDTHLKCTSKEFYDIMCEILWDAYVNL